MKQTLIIGRMAPADIIVPDRPNKDTVSARHMQVSHAGTPGSFELLDLNSSNGLCVWQNNGWMRLARATVTPDTPLRLGHYETTLRALCPPAFLHNTPSMQQPAHPHMQPAPRHPYRDPMTGEIIG